MFRYIVLPLRKLTPRRFSRNIKTNKIMADNANTPAVQAQEQACIYKCAGVEVKLTKTIVRKLLCRGNAEYTDEHLNQFMLMCQYNQLNPFLNEAYLTGYKNGKTGESDITMIVSREALGKRAESCQSYEGMESGIIINRNGEILEVEGAFMLETDVLLGGWAKVYRSDRKFPYIDKVSFKEYNKGRSTWNQIPCTMIKKVAEAQALRHAFQSQLGAMYTPEEVLHIEDTTYEDVTDQETKKKANKKTLPPASAPSAPAEQAPSAPASQPTQQEIPDAFNL